MRYLKMLGLAVVAVTASTALFGAGSASATVLCTTTDTPSCTMPYGVGTTVDFSLTGSGTFSSGMTNFTTCTSGTMKWSIANAGGATATVSGNLSAWSWLGCNTTTVTLTNGSIEMHHIAGTHNATITASGTKFTEAIFGVSCVYGTNNTVLGTLVGGASPTLTIEATLLKVEGGFLCPSSAEMKASYAATEPHALYVTLS